MEIFYLVVYKIMIRFDELDQYSFDYDIQMVVRVVESEEGE